MADLLVRGGRVIDGTGAPATTADVRVRDGIIVEVGASLDSQCEATFDADGAYVTPGFIDIHTHFDGSIWWDPSVDPMPLHGVTTVVTGNCAISLAPVNPEDQAALVDMFCYIEDLPVGPVSSAVPWTWRTWPEYRAAFNAVGASCNVAPLVGHSNLRLAVLGEESFERAASDDERERLVTLTLECLQAGAFGVSLSFVDLDSAGRRVPSRLASPDELRDIADSLASTGRGLVQYVPRFMRTDGYLKDIDRVSAACGAAGVAHTYAPVLTGRRSRETTDAVMEHTREVRARPEGACGRRCRRAQGSTPAWCSTGRRRRTPGCRHGRRWQGRPERRRPPCWPTRPGGTGRGGTGRARPSPCSPSTRWRRWW